MKIVLIGIQGAGKSTQGAMLSEKYEIPYLSSGHIFRQMATEKTELGRWLKETLNAGALVPDDTTLEVVSEYIHKPEYVKGFILDGFPRTVPQAEAFGNNVDFVVFLAVSDKAALERISGRVSDREDETVTAIEKRIALFHEKTKPVIEYYKAQGKLVQVNGEVSVDEVFQQIVDQLDTAN